MFLKNRIYTHLMFIDADIGFEPDDLLRLIEKDEPFVCSPYPKKKYEFGNIKDMKPDVLARLSEQDIVSKLLKYNVHVSSKIGPYSRTITDGFMEIDRAGTGFMLIRRDVIEKMMLRYPELKYRSHDEGEKDYEDYLWRLFDCTIDEDNCYLSEDFTFCDRWRQIGGKIWMDITARLTHTGIAHYRGNMMQVMNIGRIA
jgi:glycosyltransferase involved in cell wall biosynthesis